jgi:hypothetical protein
MVFSRRTSAHVHTVFEVNFSAIARFREAKRGDPASGGAKLTYLAFIIAAVARALRDVPVINASVDGDSVVYHKDINIGVAVALDWGLIVPVTLRTLVIWGSSAATPDLLAARGLSFTPEDVSGGTPNHQWGVARRRTPIVSAAGGHSRGGAIKNDRRGRRRPMVQTMYRRRLRSRIIAVPSRRWASHVRRAPNRGPSRPDLLAGGRRSAGPYPEALALQRELVAAPGRRSRLLLSLNIRTSERRTASGRSHIPRLPTCSPPALWRGRARRSPTTPRPAWATPSSTEPDRGMSTARPRSRGRPDPGGGRLRHQAAVRPTGVGWATASWPRSVSELPGG